MQANETQWKLASAVLPGGVCSSARLHKGLGRPFYISRAEGGRVYDLQGQEYIDLSLSFGAALIGHGHPRVVEAVRKALELGLMCGCENEWQARLAGRLAQIIPCIDMVRFTLTGTETTYYAVKLAREYTGRTLVVKFEGHFHGFNDYLAYNHWPAADELWPRLTPALQGLPQYLQQGVLVLPFNDLSRLEETFRSHGEQIAAVILEPVNYNSGTILPQRGFLEASRRLTEEAGALLIFDEILSGFRTGPGCMQAEYGVIPDLCTLGKAVGGGTPLSLFGGRRQIMEHIAPLGNAQHTGTYNGHLIEMMAGNAFLDVILEDGFYERFLPRCEAFYKEVNAIMKRLGFQGRVQGKGARCSFLFGPAAERKLKCYADMVDNRWDLLNRFYGACLRHGVYLHSMQHHGICSAHSDGELERALAGIEAALRVLMAEGLDRQEESRATFF
jgi:glutamate-1-semialdehyde 2,1-aminomutase